MSQWREIRTLEEWKQALERSAERPVVILKHSTTCPVSSNALAEFEKYLRGKASQEPEYLLVKVIESRPVSNQIAADLGVRHASPQIILINNKEAEWNSSHWSITVEHLTAVLS